MSSAEVSSVRMISVASVVLIDSTVDVIETSSSPVSLSGSVLSSTMPFSPPLAGFIKTSNDGGSLGG